jgi:hypothetical protein
VPLEPDERSLELLEKQIDRYNGIVSRLANNSVQVKTWCVTAVGAVAAVAVNNGRSSLFVVALAILGVFMLLDVNYLFLERRFRAGAHDLVQRVVSAEQRQFFVTRPPALHGRRLGVGLRTFLKRVLGLRDGGTGEVMLSFTILPFYLTIACLLLLGAITT